MKRRIIGLVVLITGVIFIILLYTMGNTDNLLPSNAQGTSMLDHTATAFIIAWVISSLLVKAEMIFNRKDSWINLSSFALFGFMLLFGLLAGADQGNNLSLVDSRTALKTMIGYTSGLLFLVIWIGSDFNDWLSLTSRG